MNVCRVFYLCLCALLILGAGLALPGAAFAQADADYVNGEIVIKLFSASDLLAVASDYGLQPEPLDQFGSRPIYRMQIVDAEPPPAKAERLVADSRIEYAEPNYISSTPEGRKRSSWARVDGVSNYTGQWAVEKIRLPAAHRVTRGAGVTVAVLDTGVDAAHAALAGRVVKGYDFVDMDADPSEAGSAEQDLVFGHGTHVAAIVALAAPDARILPVRVLDRDGSGNIWVLAEALGYAVDPDGDAETDDGAHVINLSLSTMRQTALLDEIVGLVTCATDDDDVDDDDNETANEAVDDDDDCLGRRGAVVVAAAGNNGATTPEYPAAERHAGLVAVAATTTADDRAVFSNYGPWVTLGAPGENILSAIPGNRSGAWSGTSMAAPFAAGVAALVIARAPQLPPAQAVQQMTASAAQLGGDVTLRLNAAAAVGADAETGGGGGGGAGGDVRLYLPLIGGNNGETDD